MYEMSHTLIMRWKRLSNSVHLVQSLSIKQGTPGLEFLGSLICFFLARPELIIEKMAEHMMSRRTSYTLS